MIKAGTIYTEITKFTSYIFNSLTTDWKSAITGGTTMACYSKAEIETITTIPSFNLDSNCSIALMNVQNSLPLAQDASKLTSIDKAKIAIFCIACKKGYKRIAGESGGVHVLYLVAQCE